jgi:hypothetical protein
MNGGKKENCQHENLFFTDGALFIQCQDCKIRWKSEVDNIQKQWIKNPVRIQ